MLELNEIKYNENRDLFNEDKVEVIDDHRKLKTIIEITGLYKWEENGMVRHGIDTGGYQCVNVAYFDKHENMVRLSKWSCGPSLKPWEKLGDNENFNNVKRLRFDSQEEFIAYAKENLGNENYFRR